VLVTTLRDIEKIQRFLVDKHIGTELLITFCIQQRERAEKFVANHFRHLRTTRASILRESAPPVKKVSELKKILLYLFSRSYLQ
jgi:hypothetical protein